MEKITKKGWAILWENGEMWFYENENEAREHLPPAMPVVPCEITYQINK